MTRPSTDLLKRLFAVRKQIGGLVKNKTADAGKYSYDYISLNLIIMQDDVLFRSFSPREALTFAARLKLTHMSIEDQD
jgi:hypothetical protein